MKRDFKNCVVFVVLMLVLTALLAYLLNYVLPKNEANSQEKVVHLWKPEEITKPIYDVFVFTAPWCAVCQKDKTLIEKLSKQVNVIQLNVDDFKNFVKMYEVKKIPCYIVQEFMPKQNIVLKTNDINEVFSFLEKN